MKNIAFSKEDLEKNLARIHDWIKSADQKISIFLAFQGIVITLLFPLVFKWVWKNLNNLHFLEIVALIVAFSCLFWGVIKSFAVLVPRVFEGKKNKSFTFFGDIATESLKEYKERILNAEEKDIIDDLISQTHISAKIAKDKHEHFRISMISFAVGAIILIILYAEFIFRKVL